jgi:hypothetical protein
MRSMYKNRFKGKTVYEFEDLNKLKKFQDIWLNIKNHIINSHIEAYDLLKSFSALMTAMDAKNNGETVFKNWFCDEF